MPRGQNPNSIKNLTKCHGGAGHFTSESPLKAREASAKAAAKRTARKKLAEDVNREIMESVFTEESKRQVFEKIQELALDGNAEMIKLFAKITGMDKTDLEVKKVKKDIKKTEKETKRIETDTKRIEAETELIKLKLVSTEDAEDDGFLDAIEGRLPDVWEGGDPE